MRLIAAIAILIRKTTAGMNECLAYQRQIFLIACGVALSAIVALFLIFPDTPRYSLGLLLGFVGGAIWYRIHVSSILRMLQDPENISAKSAVGASIQKYAVMVGTLLLALSFKEHFDKWATLGGLVIPQIILQVDGAVRPGHLAPQATDSSEPSEDTQ